MDKIYDVYSLGSAIVDVQTQVDDNIITKLRSAKGSMRPISEVQLEEVMSIISTMQCFKSCGGSAANSIIALAQLGGQGVFSNMVGGDEHGDIFCKEMEKLGIKFNYNLIQGHKTSTCVILVTPDTERTMFTHLGASSYLSEEIVNEDLIAKSKWIYIEGYILSIPKGPIIINKMLEIAKKYQVQVAFSCSDIFVVDLYKSKIEALADNLDLVFANKNETQHFFETSNEQECFENFKSKFKNVIMTMGSKGVKYCVNGESGEEPSFKVKAVDTTGAGDMFAGTFLYGLTHELGLKNSIKLANFLSAQVVSQFGARLNTIPDYSKVITL
ncbi:MAG: adenosine kinase [Deltaproteobacteria bacterium]|nr:adenosine kinase [Deltaproteobacteria bacterium]